MFGNDAKYSAVVIANDESSHFLDVELVDNVAEQQVRAYDRNERALSLQRSFCRSKAEASRSSLANHRRNAEDVARESTKR